MPPTVSVPTSAKRAEALALYRRLLLARLAEEAVRREYPKDQIKTPVHLGIGQEAIAVGVCHVLPRGSRLFGTYRNHPLYLAVTEDTDGFFAELYGKAAGVAKGKAGSMHLAAPDHGLMATSAVVGTTIPLAVGAAFANAYRQTPGIVAAFFGDGAVEEGVFWESLNFACLKRLRVLFVCEDNDLAIHTPASARQGFRSIPEAIRGFRCHAASGDGTDLPMVIALARQMLRRMAEDPQPGFLHLTYFRFLEHVGIHEDFQAGYRPVPTPEEVSRRDPVCRFEARLQGQGVTPAALAVVRAEVEQQIARSIRRAEDAPYPPLEELGQDVFA